jgi:molybdenum cofactor synthesis domain-containing protein
MTCNVEIISIGNELLIGQIINTNAQWIAKYISSLGGNIQRITTVGDNIVEICSILQTTLQRDPTFIITTGGLGPTFDDKTLKAITLALNRPLEFNETALKMIKERYHHYMKIKTEALELTPARLKMATLPKGAVPLPNPEGTAPGVMIEIDSSKIIALPGVPREMKAIFEESLLPMIKESIGPLFVHRRYLKVTGIIESEMAPLIDLTMHDNPDVYIKSHPKLHHHLELHFATTSNSKKEIKNNVEKAINSMSNLIYEHGGTIEEL